MAEAGQGECEGKKIVKTEERKLSQADFEALTRYPNKHYFIIRTMLVDGNINTLLLFFSTYFSFVYSVENWSRLIKVRHVSEGKLPTAPFR